VVLWSPGDVSRLPVSARALDADELASWLPMNLLAPVALIHALLPAMIERGSGAVVVAQGISAVTPIPDLASSALPQAALLHQLRLLSADLAGRGLYFGALLIGGLIERSAAATLFDDGAFADVNGAAPGALDPAALPRFDPDALADQIWQMIDERTRVEQVA